MGEPLEGICNVLLQSIGTEEGASIDKEDAADLALGIAKLMKFKANYDRGEEALLDEESPSSLTCFLCKRKSPNRTKYIAHFRSHFRSLVRQRRRRIPDSDDDHTATEEDDESEHHRQHRIPLSVKKRSRIKLADKKSEEGFSDCLGDSESSDGDNHDLQKSISNYTEEDGEEETSVSLKDRLSLAEKQLDNNETEDLICLTCLKRFSNCQNLRRHLRLHISRDSITPDIDKKFSSGDGRFFCDWCPARFDNRSAARVHEDTHKGHETKCYVCDKLYADRYSLRYHLRTHGIGRQIRCEYCNKSFSKPSRLDSHVKSHHNNIRDFKCSVCDKAFKTRIHLTNHFRQHSGERPFACEICHDRFRHKGSLLTHQRSHAGVRPYCCEVCGKTFKEPSTLKAHSRVHTGDKPYKCGACSKSFTQRAGLNYHKRLHHSGFFKCALCHFSASGESGLSAHYESSHPSDSPSHKLPSFDHLRSATAVPSPSNSPSSAFNHQVNNSQQTEVTPPPSASPSVSSGSSSPHLDLLPSMEGLSEEYLNAQSLTSELVHQEYHHSEETYHSYSNNNEMNGYSRQAYSMNNQYSFNGYNHQYYSQSFPSVDATGPINYSFAKYADYSQLQQQQQLYGNSQEGLVPGYYHHHSNNNDNQSTGYCV